MAGHGAELQTAAANEELARQVVQLIVDAIRMASEADDDAVRKLAEGAIVEGGSSALGAWWEAS